MLVGRQWAQGVIRLSDQYGRRRLEAACARAVSFGAPQYRAVKQILSQGLDQQLDLIESVELEPTRLRLYWTAVIQDRWSITLFHYQNPTISSEAPLRKPRNLSSMFEHALLPPRPQTSTIRC